MKASDRWSRGLLAGLTLALLLPLAVPRLGHAQVRDGRLALQAGRFDEALAAFEKAAAEGLAEGRAGVGEVWLKRRQYDKALEAFQLAQKMDPNLARSYWGEAEVSRRQGDCATAVPLYQKATEIDRKFPEAQLAFGQCLVEVNDRQRAVTVLSEGLKWGPKWRPKFLVALGDAELSRDSLRDAGIYYTRAREESPEDPTPRRALGGFYLKRGIPALAVPEFQAAIALDSTDAELVYQLGRAFDQDGRAAAALETYRRATDMDADLAPAQFGLGYLLYRAGQADPSRYREAVAPLQKFTTLEPKDARGWSVLARALYFTRSRDESYAAFQKAAALGDKNKDGWTIYGRLLAERREYDASLEAFTKGDPEPADMITIARLFERQGKNTQADSMYAATAEKDSLTRIGKMALGEAGRLRYKLKDYEGAIAMLSRRIALDPSNGEAYYYTGLSYKEMGRFPEALAALQQAAALDSTRADRYFWVGLLQDQQKSIPDAQVAFERAVALDTTGRAPNTAIALRQLGYYRLLDRGFGDAVQYLERSAEINPRDSATLLWLGQGYQNMGNRAKAIDYYRKTLEIEPSNAEAKRGIAVLQGGSGARQGGTTP
jgi:tetratricopeptide (TPR) repeat protein